MKIYDYGIFLSHLDLEVHKAKRYGYNFSVLYLELKEHDTYKEVIRTLLKTGLRNTDLLSQIDENRYVVLLNATRLTGAEKLWDRICRSNPKSYRLDSKIIEFQEEDNVYSLLSRLNLLDEEKRVV